MSGLSSLPCWCGGSLELDSALSSRPSSGSLPSCAVVSLLGNDPGYLMFILTLFEKLKMNFPNSLGAQVLGVSLVLPVRCILVGFGRWEDESCLSVACFPLTSKVVGMLASSLQFWGCLAAGAGRQWGLSLLDYSTEGALPTQQPPRSFVLLSPPDCGSSCSAVPRGHGRSGAWGCASSPPSALQAPSALCRRRQWHPSPVLLPGKSHGWRSLVGCSPWGR